MLVDPLIEHLETSIVLLEAAKKCCVKKGYSGVSTRDVAAEASVPLSQIHYHFGSKQGMTLALRVTIESEGKLVLFGDSFQITTSGAKSLLGN